MVLYNYHTAMGKADFRTKKPQNRNAQIPQCGAFGCGARSSANDGQNEASYDPEMAAYYYSFLREEHRELIRQRLGNPRGSFATEEMVRRLTEKIGSACDDSVIEAPTAMDRTQIRMFMERSIGPHFEKLSLIYEPPDMTLVPTSHADHDLQMTEVLAAGDNVVANFEDERSTLERSRAQTRSGIEGEVGPEIRQTDEWAKMTQKMRLDQVSAPSWPLEEACEIAGIPLENGIPILRPVDDQYGRVTKLQPWQPAAIAWLMWQLDSPLHGGILSDACGLSKTLSSLCLLYYATGRTVQANAKMDNSCERTKYRASLIVVPARVLLQWVAQIEQFFGTQFNILIFWGNPSHVSDPTRKERTVDSLDALHERLKSLDPADPKTAYTLVLSSYDTMRKRTTVLVSCGLTVNLAILFLLYFYGPNKSQGLFVSFCRLIL